MFARNAAHYGGAVFSSDRGWDFADQARPPIKEKIVLASVGA
jgi:hypothetical protein